ncbi:modifier of rudimentary (Mod(r)) protein [Hirsutella rhossiliensis]|uniref:Modifier of rudimentary (Mod(R)) protein n=1 Tax=Hirsutella rhossiliensis TaxID=111463 RepID=A0A9P8SF80_9HYPO|nr:modifier of rudimentary (Mod(r)) protein [Hirsutella rhossiliensis]KAH0960618.1 modifier of rudimentary (Mod(r)) protein [Hirsutella rhossiliensis]
MATALPTDGPAATPPAPPPKPGSHDASRMGTPSGLVPPPPPPTAAADYDQGRSRRRAVCCRECAPQAEIGPDPGITGCPPCCRINPPKTSPPSSAPRPPHRLTHAPQTAHPTLAASHTALSQVLAHNAQLAAQLTAQASSLSRQREATQARLLATHALERQWRQRQSDMDHALAPFPRLALPAPAQGVQEQSAVCHAMEESFLDSEGEPALEREVADWTDEPTPFEYVRESAQSYEHMQNTMMGRYEEFIATAPTMG